MKFTLQFESQTSPKEMYINLKSKNSQRKNSGSEIMNSYKKQEKRKQEKKNPSIIINNTTPKLMKRPIRIQFHS